MGTIHLVPGVPTSVPTPASHFWPGQDDSHPRPGESTGTESGDKHLAGQGCYSSCGPSAGSGGVLLKVLSRTKEDGRFTPCFRLKGPKQVFKGNSLPYVEHKGGVAGHFTRQLVHFHRPQGCLLSRSYRSATLEVPSLCLPGQTLSIQGPSLRTVPFTQGIYQSGCSSSVLPTGTGSADFALHRRLADLCANPHPGNSGHTDSAQPYRQSRAEGESQKEQFGTITGHHLSGCCSQHRQHGGVSLTSASRGHTGNATYFPARQDIALCDLSASVGETNGRFQCGSSGTAFPAPPANVAQQPPAGPHTTFSQVHRGAGLSTVPEVPASVERPVFYSQGGTTGLSAISERGCVYRCIFHGLGCNMAGAYGTGDMVPRAMPGTHKCPGNDGSVPRSTALPSSPARQACSGSVRQHCGSVPHKSYGRDQIIEASTMDTAASHLGGFGICQSESSPCTRDSEHGGRFFVPSVTPAGRVEAPPRSGRAHLGDLRQSRSGSFCVQRDDKLPPLVLPSRPFQPTGTGRTGTRLAQRSPLRLSSTSLGVPHSPQSLQGGTQTPPGSPLLAREDMVSTAAQALLRLANASPLQEGPIVPVGGADIASQPQPFTALGLAATGPGSDFCEFGADVRRTLRSARAPSTQLLYANRWRLFEKWCQTNGRDPVHCPVSDILSFLQELLNRGRSPSTLKVYVAAISCWHVNVDGVTVGSNKTVSLFLKGARRLRPFRRPVVPTWDLGMVLDALKSAPFEPMTEVGLKWLSMKTAFLLAMVSAKRVGELQALSVHESCCRWNPDRSGVSLWPDPTFVPKVVSSMSGTQPLQLARFDTGATHEHLCPVRALDLYIRTTSTFRKTDRLFVCFAGPRKGQALSKQRLSHWVVGAIKQAYSGRGQPLPVGVRCHSTRGITTSWAAMSGVPLEVICAAASWVTPHTFARFYRVNVATSHPLDGVLRGDTS